jgi:NADPH:quinone reductase-like Zn-dependent oxidoreductase
LAVRILAGEHGKSDIRCESVPDPKIEHPRDAIIKVTACAICGSDLHIFDGVIPGMKWSKSVRKQEAQGRRQGRGALHHFLRRPGGQAEYLRVPFADVGPLEVPNGLSDEQVLFLSDIFPTGYMAADFCAASGRPIDALLANAGRGLGRAFIDHQKVAREMKDRGHGRVLITGSIAGFMPGTFQAVYNGTKAFLDSFSFEVEARIAPDAYLLDSPFKAKRRPGTST